MSAENGKMWSHSFEIDIPREIKNTFTSILEKSGFQVLKFDEQEFEPCGYTAVWILAESHLAVHTTPQVNKAYFQITSCNVEKYINFIKMVYNLYGC